MTQPAEITEIVRRMADQFDALAASAEVTRRALAALRRSLDDPRLTARMDAVRRLEAIIDQRPWDERW